MNDLHTVFVYGTLQRGCSNHGLLAGSLFLGSARTCEEFVMRTLVDSDGRKGIPFVGRDLPISLIRGEAYLVDDATLAAIDGLEGCIPDDPEASWYRRELVSIEITDEPDYEKKYCEAYIYLHERPISPLVSSGRWQEASPIEDGQWYFAYGSNMNPARMSQRTGRFNQCIPASLPGHTLAFNKRAGRRRARGLQAYANAVPDPGRDLPGMLYRVSEQGMWLLDQFEGVEWGHYRRAPMQVQQKDVNGLSMPPTTAWVYFAGSEHVEEGLPVEDRYLHHILRGRNILGVTDDLPEVEIALPRSMK